jgi:N12 class adenine-specific DNA methylase/adenine-specific DNA methylase
LPTKFQLITELYDQTVQSVTGSYQSWTGFLRAACYNYKCPFDDQILIYAQRPDATAVLEMERWNRQFGRWVNRGAKSIAVFGDDGQNCLKLYFDVSDTHASRFARPLPIWTMHPAFEPEVIETLEATFGNLSEKGNLADAVRSACHNAVADNFTDYLQDLRDCREDSLLEELDDLNLEAFYRDALEVSVAYMLMTRLGLRADDHITADEFAHVYEFNTPPTINALGIATSDIAEMGLREISRTVMQAQRDQFFANREKSRYDDHTAQHKTGRERSKQYGDHLQDAGWLSGAEPADAADAGGASGQVRGAAEGVLEEAPQSALHQPQDQRRFGGASGRDRADRAEDGGADRGADGTDRGRDGGAESDRSAALDRPDEQFPAQRGGTGAQRPDLRLTTQEPTEAGSDELPASAVIDAAQPTIKELFEQYKQTVAAALVKDTAFVNACRNSDRENAIMEGADAIRRIVNESGDLQLAKLYFDMPAFHNRLHQELLEETYPKLVNAADHSPFKPYQVAAYHHFENGFDDKLDYQTLEEAEAAAQGYVAGTMEEDGFAYDGAAVYDAETRQCLRVYGDYPDEKAREQAVAFALEHDTARQNTAELPAFLNMHLIEANLLDDGGRKHKRQEIFEYFQAHKSLAERTEFLKNSYNDIWVEVLTDGVRTGYHAEKDGLLMWEGSYLSRTSESVFSWSVITEMTEGLIERGEYKIKLGLQNAPIVAEQLALFDMGGDAPVYEAPVDAPSGILAPARTVPQAVIDLALCTGGNEPNSAERIAVFYMRERPESENISFLRREFGTENGRGIEYEGRKYAVWFMEDGIHLAQGDSVRTGYSKTVVTWEQASARILELLEAGTYLSASELAQAPDKVLHEAMDALLMTARDLNEEGRAQGLFPQTLTIHDQHKGYPELDEDMVAFAKTEGGLQILAQEYHTFLDAYAQDRDIMHWRLSAYNTHRIGVVLDGLPYPERHFNAQPNFLRQCKMFITQDEIDQFFLRDSVDRRLAVYSHFCYPHTPEEHQKFIKGSFGEYSGGARAGYGYTKTYKGLEYERDYNFKKYDTVHLTIPNVVKEYERLIAQKRFPGEDAIAKIPEYERGQLARTVYNGFYNAPDDVPRPYPKGADFYDAVPIIEKQLQDKAKAADMLAALTSRLDGTDESDRFYDSVRRAKDRLSEYVDGTFSLFNHRHDAQLVKAVEQNTAVQTAPDTAAPTQGESDTGTMKPDELSTPAALTDEEFAAQNLVPGETLFEIDGRTFLVDRVDTAHGVVNFQDITFVQKVGFPIFRTEPISFVRKIVEQADPAALAPPQPQTDEPPAVLTPPKKKKQNALAYPLDANGSNYRITDDHIGEGAPLERFQRNLDAIRTLKTVEAENRSATAEEQAVLAQYVGWGGLADFFDEKNPRYNELKDLLMDAEYAAARESTLTAFFTPPVVIRGIYAALGQMGFTQGNILEPACGIGNFLGMLPESMSGSKLYGVELDDLSGRIARQLYQKSSIAVQGYEKTVFPDNFFDVAIGNVPFGQFHVPDKRYDRLNFPIHEYFIAKALDQVRPGGVIAVVTSSYTMDKRTASARKYIAQRSELLGAIRLPNNAFKAAAGTEVVSDILFLQKRERMVDIEPEWVHLATNENGIQMNSYFIDHPDMILGEMKMVSGPFGPTPTCEPYPEQPLEALLAEAVQNVHGEITTYDREEELEGEDHSIEADPAVRNFSYTLVDDQIYYRENNRMNPVEVSKTAESRIRGMIELRDCVRTLLEYQTEDYPDEEIKAQQAKLNALYDAFTRKYGLINSRGNAISFDQDSSYFLLCSLEILDEDRNLKRKADLFTKRTIRSHKPAEKVDTAVEALALSIGEKAHVDMDYMSRLTGKDEETLFSDLKGVIFLNPAYTGENDGHEKYLPADEYLSGNVRQKLAVAQGKAEQDPQYQINADALAQVQPTDLTASEISVRLGATWLDTEYVRRFIFETLGTPRSAQWSMKVHYSGITGEWRIEGKSKDRGNVKVISTYGTQRINAYEIIETTLNLKDVRIFDYHYDEEGRRIAVLNKKETAIAQSKQELIKDAFAEWIWKDPDRREAICKTYNILFNSNRPREYDGSHINFSGMNPEITLRKHQVNAIAHILYGGNTLLAHVVGAGKTFEMVAAAMESKRLGLCQKSLFVVPNHLTEQWATEFLQLYPAANILVATRKDFETKNRKKFCGRIATGDYDAVIIGHSQFEKIPMSVERQRAILEQQIDEIMVGISDAKREKAENFTIKQMEKTKKGLQAKIDKLNDQSRKDDVVTFEELGVDRIFIDESHYFKNLFLYTKMRNVGGIAQTEAQKSSDLFMKCRYLDEITGGRGIIFATGTPISNSMVELYTIQRYLQMSALEEQGLQHFDAWAANYGETVTAIELSPEGTGYRAKTRFAKFYNLPELMSVFKNVADIQTADMLKLPVPEAHYHNIALKPSEYQKEIVASLAERAEKVRNREVDSSVDNMLLITNDGRKLALDQRLVNPMLPSDPNSKAAKCAENVFEIWQRTADKRSTQMIFCDLSTPKDDGTFSVYDDIRAKLLELGIPENEIAFIHNAKSEVQKKDLFGKVRSGQVRILLGSTQRMGAGTNCQQKLIALHHLDCPWRPSDLQQREGRIIRQGNENPEVDIYSYVTEGTFDAYLYQLVESKQKFISQIMTSKSPVRSAEDVDEQALSYAEIKALASGNPMIKEKMDLDIEVSKLKLLKANHLSQKYALEDAISKGFPKQIAETQARIAGYGADIATVKEHTRPNADGFSPLTLAGVTYADKKEAGAALLTMCQTMLSPEATQIGSYRGLTLELAFDTFAREYRLTMIGQLRHTVTLGTDVFGNLQRMDNALEGLPIKEQTCREQLSNLQTQLEIAKVEVQKPFPRETELNTKTARLEELNSLLNLDHKESEIVDAEPDEDQRPPERRRPQLER